MIAKAVERPLPHKSDYPEEAFRYDLPPECRVGCTSAYFQTNPIARRLFLKRVHTAFELIPQRSWGRALDAGTGAGFLLPGLADLARAVVGIDLSPVIRYTRQMLAKRGIDNVTLQNADMSDLPFPAGHFDLIVCLSVIEHIPEPTAALRELSRVLTDDGVTIIGYPLEHAVFRFMEQLIRWEKRARALLCGSFGHRGKPFHPHCSHYTAIERSIASVFHVDQSVDIRLGGLALYRVQRLVKRP